MLGSRRTLHKIVVSIVVGVLLLLARQQLSAQQIGGSQLRILDVTGLMRATRVVAQSATVKVAFEGSPSIQECAVVNLDGLAAERRVPVSAQGECVFQDVPPGSWQLKIPAELRWRAQIYE
jgi:hypothetical protein